MPSSRQIENRIKTFMDFKKVINIQKIVVMKEISKRKKSIEQIKFRDNIFHNFVYELYKKHGVFAKSLFHESKVKIPIDRNIHFVMANPETEKIGSYTNKIIIKNIKENHGLEDLYIVIGKDLAKDMKEAEINVVSTMGRVVIDQPQIYKRISWQVFRGYDDLLFKKATFSFFNMITKKVEEIKIFPFTNKLKEIRHEDYAKLGDLGQIMEAVEMKKAFWLRDLDSVAESIAKFAVEMSVYFTIINYRLSLKLYELQSLDDKEKNIISEVELLKLQMQRVRKENITNELLTNSVAFMVLNAPKEEGDDE